MPTCVFMIHGTYGLIIAIRFISVLVSGSGAVPREVEEEDVSRPYPLNQPLQRVGDVLSCGSELWILRMR